MKIGIPRALLYTIYLPLWKTFLEELGHEVILSNQTDQEILNNGVKSCVDDSCLPVKIYHGHVIDLIGRSDIILMPRLISVHPGEFICPKFIGLPEMIKNSVSGSPKLLAMDFNAHSRMAKGYDGMRKLGVELGAPTALINHALRIARVEQLKFSEMLENGFNPTDIYGKRSKEHVSRDMTARRKSSLKGRIGLIGHPYLVYDHYINMNICKKLKDKGYEIIFSENVAQEKVNQACKRYPKKLFWTYGKRLLGSGLYMLENELIHGMILITSFGCGIDSFINELIIRANHREYKIPHTMITLDEHTGEAGFDTRLEAFIDMMEWRSKYDDYVSPHGADIYSG